MAKQTTQQDYVLERNARARHDDRAKNGVQAMLIFTWERKSFNLSCLQAETWSDWANKLFTILL